MQVQTYVFIWRKTERAYKMNLTSKKIEIRFLFSIFKPFNLEPNLGPLESISLAMMDF